MSFIVCWLIASFIVFYTRFSAVTVLDISFFLGVAFTGLLWALGIGVGLVLLWIITTVIITIMEK